MQERAREAETLLLYRSCIQGGWNFGSPIVLDQVIDPVVVDIAIAQFALQNVRKAANETDRGACCHRKGSPKFHQPCFYPIFRTHLLIFSAIILGES